MAQKGIHVLTLNEAGIARYEASKASKAGTSKKASTPGKSKSAHVSLTESFCSRLTPAKATAVIDYYDIDPANLSLRVSPPSKQHRAGLLTWRYGGRFAGKAFVITIGRYPDWPSKEARARAREIRVCLDKGIDPRAELYPAQAPAAAAKPVDTIRVLFEKRFDAELDKKSRSYQQMVRYHFTKFILPAWGEKDIHALTKRDAVNLVSGITNGEVTANRVATTITSFGNYLVGQGVLEANPFLKLPKNKETPRDQILTVPQLARVWRAAVKMADPAGRFIQLLVAVPVRRNEASDLPRSEITGNIWFLPKERTKPKRDFMIVLPTLAQSALDACPNTGRFMFSTTGKRPIAGFAHVKARLDEIIAQDGGEAMPAWSLHDIRRSVATCLGQLGVSEFDIDRTLNHSRAKLSGTYNKHDYAPEVAKALQKWADHFTAALAKPQEDAQALAAAE